MEIEEMRQNKNRPQFLAFLCILTFIWSGLTSFSSISLYLFFDHIKVMFSSHQDIPFLDPKLISMFLKTNKIFFLLQGIFSGLAVAGAFLMWNLKKVGFDFYVIAQLGLVFIPKLFMPNLPFPVFSLLVSVFFVYSYYIQLRFMQ